MAKGGTKLLVGCGIGCGLILLIVFLAIGSGALWVRDMADDFNDAVDLREQLDERHGDPADWVPPADGAIPAERIETFLAMRESTLEARTRIASTMSMFGMSEERLRGLEQGSWLDRTREVLRITRSGFDLAPALGEYFQARNQALLDHRMGYGEYAYLYAVGYWSLLGIDPEDGPKSLSFDAGDDTEIVNIRVEPEESSVRVQPGVMDRVRNDLLSMLVNQLEACRAAETCDPDWRRALDAELEAMRGDTDRLPWPDGPPAPTAASLEPFRERLRTTYNDATNPFELARNRRRGSWSIQSE